MESPSGYESYRYDNRGRIVAVTRSIGGRVRTASLTYDEMSRVKTETLPDGEVLVYTYGDDVNLESINGEETYASGIEYTAYGKLKQICYGNGITTTYSYYDDNTGVQLADVLEKEHQYKRK